jgi:hypothetical protein
MRLIKARAWLRSPATGDMIAEEHAKLLIK